jgi:hypothetical protein
MHETTGIAADESVTETVVEAVAEQTGRDPFDLPPLYEAVDTDALNRLVGGTRADRGSNLTVTFTVAGCRVRVTGTGEVRVERGREDFPSPDAACPEATTDKSVAFESSDIGRSETVESSANNRSAE